MKKLLFVISQLYKGGAETSLVNLLNRLDYSKYSVELLILNQEPLKDAVSLIDRVNNNVTVCDAYAEYQRINTFDRVQAKLFYNLAQKGAYYITALDFVRNKSYDWAFYVGEWSSPSFVAYEVQSLLKAAWIHNDLSEAEYFDDDHYFYFADLFDYFIFVSKFSLEASVKAYPFLKNKAITIYNINDVDYIRKRAQEKISDYSGEVKLPILLTCANFRPQKNHIRQVQVMAELKKRGVDFTWLNIGATTDQSLVTKVKGLCDKNGLTNAFKILGPKENPYSYIKRADAVLVLSDYESWSMVITEAKILGTPVISTKTSGAMEQIEDGKTGMLTNFDIENITDKIENFLKNEKLRNEIRKNTGNFDNTQEIIDSFDKLIASGASQKETADIIYIIDDINFMGGAHIATKLQIKEFVKLEKKIAVFSSVIPNLKIRKELPTVIFLSFKDFEEDILYNKRLCFCIFNKNLTTKEKWRKFTYTYKAYCKKLDYGKIILPYISDLFSKYERICVMSEGSSFRKAAAASTCRKKIQWIHTDYCVWRNMSNWTKIITEHDNEIYKPFDVIVTLSENIKQEMAALYPELADKIIVNKNIMPVEEIINKAEKKTKNRNIVKFITVGRMDNASKACYRLLKILTELAEEGYLFQWIFVGDGDDYYNVKVQVDNGVLRDYVILKGAMKNPFPEMKKADVFALPSTYEGLPNTIYEALILGIPVLATNVGGIAEQLIDGENGWLVANDEDAIKNGIIHILMHPDEMSQIRRNVSQYKYDNERIIALNKHIFTIDL